MLFIFPDTNIFIHGKHFEEIDWLALTGTSEVTIMIAPSVIAELDKHKYNPIRKVAQRARKQLPRIEEGLKNIDCCKWKLQAMLRRPATELFESNHLDPKDQDDVLLASIIEFKTSLTSSDQVILITNDTGPRLKAFSLQVPAQSLPDEYIMNPEADEAEKKINALQKELEQHKSKIPAVSLLFGNGNNYLEVEKSFELISKEEYVTRELEKIVKEFPQLVFREDSSIRLPNGQRLQALMFSLSLHQVEAYNEELNDFYAQYGKYLGALYDQINFLHNCCEVSLVVKNTGSVPAQDLDIHMHFPDGFDMIEMDEMPKVGKKPVPPYKPKHAMDYRMPVSPLAEISSLLARTQYSPDLSKLGANVGRPEIKKTNSYDVKVHIRSVKHNQSEELNRLWLKFDDIRHAKGFTIDYLIMAANIPQVVPGKLNVNFLSIKV